jgi:hypothetical protein
VLVRGRVSTHRSAPMPPGPDCTLVPNLMRPPRRSGVVDFVPIIFDQ